MEKSAVKLNCYDISKMTMHSKKRNRRYKWWSWRMDIDEQKNRNCSYLMRGYSQSLKSKLRTKEKKHEFI